MSVYRGRGSYRAYKDWLRDMEMDAVAHGEMPELTKAVLEKIERNTRPARRFSTRDAETLVAAIAGLEPKRPYRTSNES